MHDERPALPDSTAVRVALWQAMHMQLDRPPHGRRHRHHLSQGFFHGFATPSGVSGLAGGCLGKGSTSGDAGATAVVSTGVCPWVALAAIRSASVRLATRTAA